jgi:hypothetical protein
LCADRGILRRSGNPIDPFRGIAVKYAQELLARIACQFCDAGMYEKAA